LGPSHTYYLRGCALTTYDKYETPFGDLVVDKATTTELQQKGLALIPRQRDVDEHSLEMHLPYLWKRLEQTFGNDGSKFPTIVPILVGDGSADNEKAFGTLLAPYLRELTNAFIVSSDFCHWGSRFGYRPHYSNGAVRNLDSRGTGGDLRVDTEALEKATGIEPPIHEVIRVLDEMAMDAVKTGAHNKFYEVVQSTENTVCGRHPIGVVMAGLEVLAKEGLEEGKGRFRFIQYQRSNLVKRTSDSSVSYASAFAVV